MFQKQADLIRLCSSGKSRFNLASGPRISGKSLGCLHVLAHHAWHTDPANIALLTITQSAGYDSGIWTDLTQTTIPEWIDDGAFGMEWAKKPAIQHVSKKPYFSVTNSAGYPVQFTLESLKNEGEVEQRFKGKRYSAIFINELSNFKQLKTFLTLTECLRMLKRDGTELEPQKHLLLADTNPADEGTNSWIYKVWFELPYMNLDEDAAMKEMPIELRDAYKLLQPLVGSIEFSIDDNPFVSAERKEQLRASLAMNRDLYARYWEGKWVTASLDALFINVFRENFHVVGEIDTGRNTPLFMTTEPGCFELFTGWDLGVVNSAFAIIEKTIDPNAPGKLPVFKVLDELAIVGEDFSMDDFVVEAVKKMKKWQEIVGKPVRWIHYSDRSAFDMRDAASNRYHHQIVYDASPEDTPGGRIVLRAAARGKQSVQQRVDLMRKLLWEERIFFSATHTPGAIEMLKSIKRGKSALAPIERGNKHKHIFDAIMYAVASECYDEIAQQILATMRKNKSASGVVSISL